MGISISPSTSPTISIEQYQQLQNFNRSRRGSHIKLFHGNKFATRPDLIELIFKFEAKFKSYQVVYKSFLITIHLSENLVKVFDDIQEFQNADLRIPNQIESITIDLEYHIDVNGALERSAPPDRYIIKFKIGEDLKPWDIMRLIYSETEPEDIGDLDVRLRSSFAVCRLNYCDSTIAAEIFAIIQDWIRTLSNQEIITQTLLQKLFKHREKIAIISKFAAILVCCLGLAVLTDLLISNFNDLIKNHITYILISIIYFMILFSTIGEFWENKMREHFYKISRIGYFHITSGDVNKKKELNEKNEKNSKDALLSFFGTIVVDIILGVLLGHLNNWFR